jgi:hypothetical protein
LKLIGHYLSGIEPQLNIFQLETVSLGEDAGTASRFDVGQALQKLLRR